MALRLVPAPPARFALSLSTARTVNLLSWPWFTTAVGVGALLVLIAGAEEVPDVDHQDGSAACATKIKNPEKPRINHKLWTMAADLTCLRFACESFMKAALEINGTR